MQDMLRFLYIALREYWITWVTGTGLCGFTLWLINFISEKVRDKPMSLRTYIAVLFCFFWFLATFSAWHDADKNLQAVIKQRQEDTGNLGQCNVNLRAERAKTEFLDAQNKAQQTNLANMQQTINTQTTNISTGQTAITNLVTQFGKLTELQPQKIIVKAGALEGLSTQINSIKQYVWVVVAIPNKPISPVHGIISCEHAFTGLPSAKLPETGVLMDVNIGAIDNKRVNVKFSAPVWTPDTPLIIAGLAPFDVGTGKCNFENTP
jgi:hypothetical protein